jgi:hypothetical protein
MDTNTSNTINRIAALFGSSLLILISLLSAGQASANASTAAAVSFTKLDTVPQGNWRGTYGGDGYSIANDSQNVPSYATYAVQNQLNWTWANGTSDPRALQCASCAGRIAATWYSASTFNLDINLTDGNTHQIAVYALDWDTYMGGRVETIQVVDANSNAVLDTRSISGFSGGVYMVWNISGHVRINITANTGNAVINGVFFGKPANVGQAPATPATATAPVITTQPASQTVAVGQTATFTVADTGTAPLTYQWLKNGAAISGATNSSYTTPAATASNSGSQFSVVVSNGAGSATSNAAVLTVNATYILTASTTALNFGSVNVSGSGVQSVTLTNCGTGNVTISNVSVSGAGFSASGVPTGTVLAPGQSANLNASFAPATSGNATGSISVSSNAGGGAIAVALSGTGAASADHSVMLSWSPSTSVVIGYNVYVSGVSGSSYVKVTSSPVPTTGYTDSGIETAQTRYYVVTSVDANNNESAFSNQVTAIVP